MRRIILGLFLMSTAVTTNAQVERENGFYAVVTTGPTTFNLPGKRSLSSNGYQLGLGYDLNKYLAVEMTYGSLYQLSSSGAGSSYDESINALNASLLVLYPTGNLTPYVKVGSTTVDVTLRSAGSPYKEESNTVLYAAGAELKMDQRTAVRLEYGQSQKKTSYTDLNYINAGVIVRF